jgi:hypothetical protein
MERVKVVSNTKYPTKNKVVTAEISHSDQIYELLFSTVYQNKIGSIVRELISNAYDAHIENNSTERIDVDLTSDNFIVRDYGKGLSESNVQKNLNSYFRSSKRSSNKYIGCFGLGSMVPYSYTDKFIIISYFNNKQYTYLAVLNNNIPTLQKVEEIKTKEKNGIKFIIPIKSEDKEIWIKEIRTFCYYSGINFNSNLGELNSFDYESSLKFKKNNFNYYIGQGMQRYSDNILVKQGIVVYSIPPSLHTNFIRRNTTSNLIIEVPIGSVTPTISRESLSMEELTIKTLTQAFEDYIEEFIEMVNKEIEQKKIVSNYNKNMMFLAFQYMYPFSPSTEQLRKKINLIIDHSLKVIEKKDGESSILKYTSDKYKAILEANTIISIHRTYTDKGFVKPLSFTKITNGLILSIFNEVFQKDCDYTEESFKEYLATIKCDRKKSITELNHYKNKVVLNKFHFEILHKFFNYIDPKLDVTYATKRELEQLQKSNIAYYTMNDFKKKYKKKIREVLTLVFLHKHHYCFPLMTTLSSKLVKILDERIINYYSYLINTGNNKYLDQFYEIKAILQININTKVLERKLNKLVIKYGYLLSNALCCSDTEDDLLLLIKHKKGLL